MQPKIIKIVEKSFASFISVKKGYYAKRNAEQLSTNLFQLLYFHTFAEDNLSTYRAELKQKRLYSRETIRGIIISRLSKITPFFHDWLSSLN